MAKNKRKPKLKPVTFTFHERRVFELGFDKKHVFNKPEDIALRKMLDCFPWLEIVAEFRFDPKVADAAAAFGHADIQLRKAMQECRERQCPPKQTSPSSTP